MLSAFWLAFEVRARSEGSGFDRDQVLQVDGEPYWHSGIQFRADKLLTAIGYRTDVPIGSPSLGTSRATPSASGAAFVVRGLGRQAASVGGSSSPVVR